MFAQQSIGELLQITIKKFGGAIDPREIRDLLAFVLKQDPVYLIAHPSKNISAAKKKQFLELLNKRKAGIPFAYLVSYQPFYGLNFFINSKVLIPRPETEQLVDIALKAMVSKPRGIIADIGTGSGCIAIALAIKLPQSRIIASDVSLAALQVAKINARRLKVQSHINFRNGSLLTPIQKKERLDLLIANLPYLTAKETSKLPNEPRKALYGGDAGVKLIESLLKQLQFKQIPKVILEVSPTQIKRIQAHLNRHLKYSIDIIQDYMGRNRFVVLTKNQ
jgi:release factor glutamine methyltransferase